MSKKIFQTYANMDYDELLDSARQSYDSLYEAFVFVLENKLTASEYILSLIYTTVCADGKFTDLEVAFINDLFKTRRSREELWKIVRKYSTNDAYACANKLFDGMPENVKAELLNLCLCVCAVDERITREEVDYVLHLVD